MLAHGPLIAAFSFSAVSFSFVLRGGQGFPRPAVFGAAFLTSFLFFLQLRIADEFKDFEEDARYRPYRPVPRGLVKLSELRVVFILGGVIQLALALALLPKLALLLCGVWLYLAGMCKEFFVRDWLKARPITYMWTHMLIMPLIDLYATACDWESAGFTRPPSGLFWFLLASLFNGFVIEIGRKLRAPPDEETGVQTYTVLWGRRNAVLAWLSVMALTAFSAGQAARRIDCVAPVGMALGLLFLAAALIGWRFVRQPVTARARLFEPMTGVWTLLLYLSLGAGPLLMRAMR